jgi:hypothetical protein
LQRRKQRNTDLREIFGAAQFSTFSTVSARSSRSGPSRPLKLIPRERTGASRQLFRAGARIDGCTILQNRQQALGFGDFFPRIPKKLWREATFSAPETLTAFWIRIPVGSLNPFDPSHGVQSGYNPAYHTLSI